MHVTSVHLHTNEVFAQAEEHCKWWVSQWDLVQALRGALTAAERASRRWKLRLRGGLEDGSHPPETLTQPLTLLRGLPPPASASLGWISVSDVPVFPRRLRVYTEDTGTGNAEILQLRPWIWNYGAVTARHGPWHGGSDIFFVTPLLHVEIWVKLKPCEQHDAEWAFCLLLFCFFCCYFNWFKTANIKVI